MDNLTDDSSVINFQHIFESLMFEDIKSSKTHCSPSLKADIQRKILAQLYYSANSGKAYVQKGKLVLMFWVNFYFQMNNRNEDSTVSSTLYNQYMQKYSQIVDEKNDSVGLDNYSKGALALTSSCKNGKNIIWIIIILW